MDIKKCIVLVICMFMVMQVSATPDYERCTLSKKPLIIFDLDDTLTRWGEISVTEMIRFFSHLIFHNITQADRAVVACYHHRDVKNVAKQFAAQKHATAEYVGRQTLQWLMEHGYGDFRHELVQFLKFAINPQPIQSMLTLAKKFRQEGYIMVAATAQDGLNHLIYRRKLKQQGIDLDTLFDVTFTSYSEYVAAHCKRQPVLDHIEYVTSDNFYTINTRDINKPDVHYFELLASLLMQKYGVHPLVFIDDKKENVDAFDAMLARRSVAGHGILFNIPKKRYDYAAEEQAADDVYNEFVSRIKQYTQQKPALLATDFCHDFFLSLFTASLSK